MANPIPDDKLREACAEAARQLANRERRDGLRAMLDALLRARDFLDDAVDTRLVAPGRYAVRRVDKPLCDEAEELNKEIRRINLEIKTYAAYVIVRPAGGEAFDRLGKQCARVDEDLAAATERILLERGASTYQTRQTLHAGNDSKRKAADRAKRALHGRLNDLRSAVEGLVERHLPITSRAGWEQYGADLEKKIDNLSVDRKTAPDDRRRSTAKKNKSSSRKRG